VGGSVRFFRTIVLKNGVAYGDALVADISARIVAWRRDELPNYVLTLMAK
jgi:hypothetical protein